MKKVTSIFRLVSGVVLVLLAHLAQAQMYFVTSGASNNIQRMNVGPTPTFTVDADIPDWVRPTNGTDAPVTASVADTIFVQQVNNTATLLRYRISTNTWLPNLTVTGGTSRGMYTDGTNLFQQNTASTGLKIYNYSTKTFTASTVLTVTYNTMCSGVGVLYYNRTSSGVSRLFKYDHSTTSITDLGILPAGTGTSYMCADANNVYLTNGDSNNPVAVYNISSATWSTSKTLNNLIQNGFGSDGTYLYAKSGATVWQFTIANPTGNWTQLTTSAISAGSFPRATMAGSYYLPAAPVCAAPVAMANTTEVTCTGGTANNDGKIILSTFNTNAKKVDYTIGSTYTGAGFGSATTITGGANFTVASTLPNPTVNQPYTLRVFCDATTFIDKTVLLTPKKCATADLQLSISPPTSKTGAQGEPLTYIVTLTNGSATTVATNVVVSVPMPTPTASLLSATAASGAYNTTTQKWTVPSVAANGSTTLTFTVKVD